VTVSVTGAAFSVVVTGASDIESDSVVIVVNTAVGDVITAVDEIPQVVQVGVEAEL
jgi:hypothetical protein